MKNIFLLAAFLLSLHGFAQVPSYVSTNGIVGYWPFSGNANDVSGNGNNGTVNGATLTTDRYGSGGSAYYFSSASCGTYIGANINTNAITSSGAMTLSFWFKRIGNGCLGARIMELGSCTTCAGQILVTDGGGSNIVLRHYLTATDFVTYTFTGLTNSTWYHIVYTNDGTNAKYYLDGTLVSTIPSPNPAQLSDNAAFGRMNHPSYDAFNGDLDDIGLWSRALTACEVSVLHTEDPSATFAYNALPDTTYMCDTVSLNAGDGYTNYSWSSPTITLGTANNQTLLVNTSGKYFSTVTNSSGCTATDSTQVIIIKPTATADKTSICKGGSVTLNATGIAGTSQTLVGQFYLSSLEYNQKSIPTIVGNNYVMTVSGIWSVHFCTDANNVADAAFYYQRNPIQALPNNLDWVQWNGTPLRPDGNTYNSSHTYTYTTAPSTQTVQTFTFVDPSDNASHTNTSAYTDNCDSLLFQIYQINKSTATYTWSANPSTTAGLSSSDIHKQSLTATPTVTTMYYVIVNDGIVSCEDSIQITIATVDTTLTVSGATTICSSGTANVGFTAGTDNSYKWLLNNSPIIGATTKTYTATQTGTYSVAVTNSIGCIDTGRSVSISLYANPVAGFSINNASQCLSGNSFVYTNTSSISSGTLSYVWNLGDEQKAVSKDTTYTYHTANNNYTIKLISTSNKGCSDSISKTVVVKSMPSTPVITANGTLTFCENGSVVLTSDTAQGNQWYLDENKINNAVNQTYTATISGDYTIIATANSCASDVSNAVTVTVNPTPSTPIITANGPVAFCANERVVLSSDASTGNQWYLENNKINSATTQTYTATTAGTYTVINTVNNCPSTTSNSITVTINPITPTPAITSDGPLTFCDNGSVVLTSSIASGNQWFESGNPLSATGKTYTAVSAGVYNVIATAANACPSDTSLGVSISIIPSPHGIRYDAVNAAANTPTILQARAFGEAYSWIPSSGLTNAATATPTFNYSETTDYLIHITTSTGCFTDDTVLVNVYNVKGFLIPTAFTPNGDGLNDVLKVFTIDIKQLNYFRIYNKWGQQIFETTTTANAWDGFYNGTQQPSGNYIWIGQGIDNDGHIVTQHGQIILIR